MPTMSQINIKKSKYWKVKELEEATGLPWGKANLVVTVVRAWVDEYDAQDGNEPEPAFLLELAGHSKPLGCNLTNRKTIEGIMGDVEWDTASLGGMKLEIYAVSTERGTGVRVRFHQETPPVEAAPPMGGDPVHDSEPPPPSDADAGPF